MTGSTGEPDTLTWSVPECPFTIEASTRVLDDIRLAVVDAFFSLPRGGAEIGGVLLGSFTGNRLTITDYSPLECEHAHGPSFSLSAPDEVRLNQILSIHNAGPGEHGVVGWYHSHTRSEIFLSEADQAIHQRFFPEPWQVALVMKPHTFQPARIGFFFRAEDGSMHAEASYQEMLLEGLRVQAMPGPVPTVATTEELPLRRRPNLDAIKAAAEAAPEPEPALQASLFPPYPVPESQTPEYPAREDQPQDNHTPAAEASADASLPAPHFLAEEAPAGRSWTWVIILAIALGVAAAAVQTRQMWLPRVMAAVRPVPPPPPPPPSLGLTSLDHEGQLQINWNPNSPAVRKASDAILEITEIGTPPQAIQLDAAHLQAGNFTFARNSQNVDIKLIVHQANGPDVREAIGFLGKLPARQTAAPESGEQQKQREEDKKATAKLKSDLNFQAAKTRKLEKDLVQMRQELKQQQLKRLNNQVPDKQ